jgi:hypothetical protein
MNYKKWKTIVSEREGKKKSKPKDIKLNDKVTITITKCNNDNIVKVEYGTFYVFL